MKNVNRKYSYNSEFFHAPNILNCYYAGLLASDGYVAQNNGTNSYILGIRLNTKDIAVLESFKSDIEFDGPIAIYNNVASLRITLYDDTRRDLEEVFHIHPNKTFDLLPPTLCLDNSLAYVVGYIDGDGCICRSNDNLSLQLLGNNDVLSWIKQHADQLVPSIKLSSIRKYPNENIYRYSIGGKRAHKFLSILSEIDVPKLSRKWCKVS